MLSIWNLNTRHRKEDVVRAGNRDFLHLTAASAIASAIARVLQNHCNKTSLIAI